MRGSTVAGLYLSKLSMLLGYKLRYGKLMLSPTLCFPFHCSVENNLNIAMFYKLWQGILKTRVYQDEPRLPCPQGALEVVVGRGNTVRLTPSPMTRSPLWKAQRTVASSSSLQIQLLSQGFHNKPMVPVTRFTLISGSKRNSTSLSEGRGFTRFIPFHMKHPCCQWAGKRVNSCKRLPLNTELYFKFYVTVLHQLKA